MKDYTKKIVYITGGSSGIGLSTAMQFAGRGAHVLIFARTRDRLERACAEIKKQARDASQRIAWMELDVSQHDKVEKVIGRALKEFGAPDVLVNCAGRAYPRRFEDISYEQFDDTMKTNCYSIWNTVSVLAPAMKNRDTVIVNVSSMAGFVGVFGYADYAASKFAIVGLSEVLKSELKWSGIRVQVLCPPDTDTPGFQTENKTKPEETKAISASAKVMTPDQIAQALMKGLEKKTFMIVPGFDGKTTYIAKRLFPGLVDFIMDMSIKKVQKGKSK